MTPRQREIAAESYVVYLLAQAGYDISLQYGASKAPYDLIAVKGKRFLPISIRGSQEGAWMLPVRYKERATSYDEAIDRWLATQRDDVVLAFVQLVGPVLGNTPQVYLARPVEVVIHLKSQRHESSSSRHTDSLPPNWRFSLNRVDAI